MCPKDHPPTLFEQRRDRSASGRLTPARRVGDWSGDTVALRRIRERLSSARSADFSPQKPQRRDKPGLQN
jgi:hypothetical protein